MKESPRFRRLKADFEALKTLDAQSSIFSFESLRSPPSIYHVTFRGLGIWRMGNGELSLRDRHEVSIELAAAYPRMIPNLSWRTPIFHPNISSSGVVCLGGYGTNWVPSLSLDELCTMLWDMIRYKNFDPESPYNKDAAIWTQTQTQFQLPLDPRSLRDRVATAHDGQMGIEVLDAQKIHNVQPPPVVGASAVRSPSAVPDRGARGVEPEVPMEDIQIVEVIDTGKSAQSTSDPPGQDILFID